MSCFLPTLPLHVIIQPTPPSVGHTARAFEFIVASRVKILVLAKQLPGAELHATIFPVACVRLSPMELSFMEPQVGPALEGAITVRDSAPVATVAGVGKEMCVSDRGEEEPLATNATDMLSLTCIFFVGLAMALERGSTFQDFPTPPMPA